jgi:hypothetical protein
MTDTKSILISLSTELIKLLKILKPSEWEKKTGYSNFTIKDIVDQLLNSETYDSLLKSENTQIFVQVVEKYLNNTIQQFSAEKGELNEFLIDTLYAKHWLAQQQIRFALNNQKLLSREFYHPYLNTVMQILPTTYTNVDSFVGSIVKVEIVGEAGGTWSIIKNQNNWSFFKEEAKHPTAIVYIDQQIAWLLFSKEINPMDAVQYYQLHGDTTLASYALNMF